MSYYADTVVTVHRTGLRSAAPAALTAPLPDDGPFPQQLRQLDTADAGGSKTFTGRVYAGALRVDITRIADWFTALPWDGYDLAVLTATDGEQSITVTVAAGHATRVRIDNDPPADAPAGGIPDPGLVRELVEGLCDEAWRGRLDINAAGLNTRPQAQAIAPAALRALHDRGYAVIRRAG